MTSELSRDPSAATRAKREDPDGPIFIVGSSRSGTSLARATLNGHPDVELAGETHYFDDLRTRLPDPEHGALSADDRRRCQDYFLALSHRPYGHSGNPERGWLGRDVLEAAAQRRGGAADAYFEAFCRLLAERSDGRRWGEKTPRHVFRIGEMLERYPNARVVCLLRDPRAVIASYRDWTVNRGGLTVDDIEDHTRALEAESARTRGSYDLLLASLLWRSEVRAMFAAQRKFDRSVRIERYESLVQSPEEEARELADFVGVDFEASMLEVPVLNSSFDQFERTGGFSSTPLTRWKSLLSPVEISVVQQTCGSVMRDAGYDPEPTQASLTAVGGYWARLPVTLARAGGYVNRDRLGNPVSYVWRRLSPLLSRDG